MKASILIVTKNRAADLLQTLRSLRLVHVPDSFGVELIVVDNGSTDDTAAVVKATTFEHLPLRCVHEPHGGQTFGRNRGLAESSGDVILFTDDDIRPSAEWLVAMCEPILQGKADAVSGGVSLAPHLLRPWMTPVHRSWLAATDWLDRGNPQSMVGANMAFARRVLDKVPGFDPELGPGALGFGDDGLFASQLLAADYKIHDKLDVGIEHHFDASRLTRESWLKAAEMRGNSHAYLGHHWEHWGCRFGRVKVLRAKARLAAWRSHNGDMLLTEGCELEEMDLVFELALARAHLKESARARNYERHGLAKL